MAIEKIQDNAGVIAFPPLMFASTLALGLLVRYFLPTPFFPREIVLPTGAILLIIGVLTLRRAMGTMRQNNTTINPSGTTTTIVTAGIYQYTRNPMYLSLTLIYLGISIMFNAWWGLLLLISLLIVVQKGVIEREEKYLTGKFGEEYLSYKTKVRRWV